jgi:hypothetical protein
VDHLCAYKLTELGSPTRCTTESQGEASAYAGASAASNAFAGLVPHFVWRTVTIE